jgi:hypothetical protein
MLSGQNGYFSSKLPAEGLLLLKKSIRGVKE